MTEKVVDDLRKTVVPGSRLSIAAASFSLYAFETLKDELWKIDSLRFIFTSRTFVKKQASKESREFDISRNAREQALNEEQSARERSLFGSEFELKLRNQLNHDYSGAAEPPVRKNGSHHSRPREPPIYSSFVWSNSACCCRAGFHKPVRASRLPTSSLEAHAML